MKIRINFRMKYSVIFLIMTYSTISHAVAQTAHIDLDQASGDVQFKATGHPSALKINGKGEKPKGTLKINGKEVTGKLEEDLSSFDTGIALRNRHLTEKYLEVQKYPRATLTLTQVKLPTPLQENMVLHDIPFQGVLNLHGVDHPVSGKADFDKKGGKATISANFDFKIKDYGIAQPSFAGITVADDVHVEIKLDAPITQQQSNSEHNK